MKPTIVFAWPMLICLWGPATAGSYYEDDMRTAPSGRAHTAKDQTTFSKRSSKQYIVEGGGGAQGDILLDRKTSESIDEFTYESNSNKAIGELEEGLAELGVYSSEYARHIQRNGMSGIFEPTEEIKRRGRAIGGHLGGSVREVSREMEKDLSGKR